MLDTNDIQIISKIVSDAIAENNKVLRADMTAMFAEERKHTEAMFAEERKHTEAMFAQQKEELRAEMRIISAQQKEEVRADMLNISVQQKEELRAEMLNISAQQKKEMHEDMMTIVESEINPKLRILAEGHEALLERMTPPEEIENMKTDIFILKEAVKNLGTKVKALQKAQ